MMRQRPCRVVAYLLVCLLICYSLPNEMMAQPSENEENYPENKIEVLLEPEIKIDDRSWLGRNWLWGLLGTVLIGATAAMAISIGGGDGDDSESGNGKATYVNGW